MPNIWLLTEERPKVNVVRTIVEKFCKDHGHDYTVEEIKITPILKDKKFTFTYKVEGISCDQVDNIFIKTISGDSSLVDYMVFYEKTEPTQESKPIYAIEETKTDDSESRNTGVYQRCSKFVYVEFFYPGIKKIMLYNLQIAQKETPTQTSIFGTRMLLTIGVEILGKKHDPTVMKPFTSVEELIAFKDAMRKAPTGNVPIQIVKYENKITVSGRLVKAGHLGHDPNIGALTIIAQCLRNLGWKKDIEITLHGLTDANIGKTNKFIKIANRLGITLEGVNLPNATASISYWHYTTETEKLASIFLHLTVERYTNGKAIYENHAGSERGYLYDKELKALVIPKYQEGLKKLYKDGDKSAIISISDVIVFDVDRNEIINIEAKMYSTRKLGIEEIKNYGYLEDKYITPLYKPESIKRTVVIFGSNNTSIEEPEIGFMMTEDGGLVLGSNPPAIIKEAVEKLLASQ